MTVLRAYYRRYDFAESRPEIISEEAGAAGEAFAVTVCADVFTPVTVLECPDDRTRMSDNYFALLPGEERTVLIEGDGLSASGIRVRALMPERKRL